MRTLARPSTLVCGVLLLALPAPSAAQDRAIADVAGGYAYMRDFRVDDNFPLGWFVSGSYNITDWLAAVGEIGGSYKRSEVTFEGTDFSSTTRLHTFLAGPRYARRVSAVTAFGQVLAGAAHESGGTIIFRQSIAEPQTKFALQPGGGVHIPLTDRLSARVAGDYRRIFAQRKFAEERDNDELRLTAGIVLSLGTR